jgi:transglutaminase superfamily protein
VTAGALPRVRRRLDVQAWRAAWWAHRALGQTRERLACGELGEISLAAPPALPDGAEFGVHAVLRRRSASCLERSLVLQRWHAAHGRSLDVVIGVNAPVSDFLAHAWLDGEPAPADMTFDELVRLSP